MITQDIISIDYATKFSIDNKIVSKKYFLKEYWKLKKLWGPVVKFDLVKYNDCHHSSLLLNMHTPTVNIKQLSKDRKELKEK